MQTKNITTNASPETKGRKTIRCLCCNGRMRLTSLHFADGLSTVPHMTHAALECDDCGEYMQVRDAVLCGWATEAEAEEMAMAQEGN